MRQTMREIGRRVSVKRETVPGFVPVIKATAVGNDKGLRLVGSVTIDADTFECASDNGKIRTFSDVDGFLKFVAKCAEKGDGVYSVEVDTGQLLASSVPANIPEWAQSQITRLGKVKTAQNAVIAGLDSQLALMTGWESGNLAQQAKKAEVQAQRAAVVTDIAAIDAEVLRLTALV